nr:HNH endonuclease [Marinitoga okinawensis]
MPNDDSENKKYVNHKDFNRGNNHVDNLEWVSARENILHRFTHSNKANKNKNVEFAKYDVNGNFVCKYKTIKE